MSITSALLDTLKVTSDRGRSYVWVPWSHADELHSYLQRRGYRSTLCLDPASREAQLELWPGVDPAEVLGALDELRHNQPATPTTLAV